MELGRRSDVRHPARLGRQHLDVEHRRRDGRPRLVGRGVRTRLAVRGKDHGLRQPHLHRGRRAVPVEDAARPRHQEPLRADPGAARRRGRAPQGAEEPALGVLVALHRRAGRVRRRHQRRRHDLAGHHELGRSRRHEGQGSGAEGRLDRVVRHVDDLVEGEAPQLHVHVDGLHHLAVGERPSRRVVR